MALTFISKRRSRLVACGLAVLLVAALAPADASSLFSSLRNKLGFGQNESAENDAGETAKNALEEGGSRLVSTVKGAYGTVADNVNKAVHSNTARQVKEKMVQGKNIVASGLRKGRDFTVEKAQSLGQVIYDSGIMGGRNDVSYPNTTQEPVVRETAVRVEVSEKEGHVGTVRGGSPASTADEEEEEDEDSPRDLA